MTIKLSQGAGNQEVVVLTNEISLDPYEVTIATIRCAEPMILDNSKTIKIMVPSFNSSTTGLTMCPTIFHPSRDLETVIANTSDKTIKLVKNQAVGILTPAMCTDMQELASRDNVCTNVEEIKEYLIDLIDYRDESAVPSVLTSPVYLPEEHNKIDSARVASVHTIKSDYEDVDLRGFDVNPALDNAQKRAIMEVLDKYNEVFDTSLKEIKTLNTAPYTIRLKENAKPLRSRAYVIPHDAQEWLKETLEELLHTGKIERSSINNE